MFFCVFLFWDRVFLSSPGCPRTFSVLQWVGRSPSHSNLPASAFLVLGLHHHAQFYRHALKFDDYHCAIFKDQFLPCSISGAQSPQFLSCSISGAQSSRVTVGYRMGPHRLSNIFNPAESCPGQCYPLWRRKETLNLGVVCDRCHSWLISLFLDSQWRNLGSLSHLFKSHDW